MYAEYILGNRDKSDAAVCRCSVKKVFLNIFTKFTKKHLCQSLFFNKVAGLRPATLLRKDTGTSVFQ